jgi:tetratricopeptide (TPR) repeat protein
MSQCDMGDISAAHDAVGRGEWREALDALDAAGSDATDAAGLELRATAHYGDGDFEASVSAWEDLHTLSLERGDRPEAARAAAMVAMFVMMDTGLMAAVRGWVRRAERVLEGLDETPAHAIIAVVRGYERFMCGDMAAAGENAARAIELGTRMGVAPVVMIGRVCTARVTIFDGDVADGLEQLDEIAIDLMSGAVDPLTTGIMYCELICAAQGMALHDKATEWTDVMHRWRHGAEIGAVGGRCRVHRAEILRMSGPCDLAEEEALGACDELRPWMRREFGWPLVELGNIRLRRGDLDGAEEAFLAAHEHAWSPHPGLALLRLAQGDIESATTMIADAIEHPFDIPSKERPPFGDLRLAPLLDAQAEIAAAAGDAATARQAATALSLIAGSYPSRSLAAGAAVADARAALVEGDLDKAIHEAKAATAAWADVGAPFEAAMARMVLGEAHSRAGNPEGARMEWRAAGATFETFGAAGWAARAAALLDSAPSSRAPTETRDEPTAIFRCEGDTRTICFGDQTVQMRDLKGFRYIERMLAEPGREFHALDLVAVEQGTLRTGRAMGGADVPADAGSGLPALDDAARAAYRRRLADVDEDIEEATRLNDLGRVELAQRDREYLIAELTRAVGLGGRQRVIGSDAERARTSVTRSIRYSLERLAEHHPSVAAHLGQSVHTGTYCMHTPDPLAPVVWQI